MLLNQTLPRGALNRAQGFCHGPDQITFTLEIDIPENRMNDIHMVMMHEVVDMLRVRPKSFWMLLFIYFLID